MYNHDLLYKKTADELGISMKEVKQAVTHYYSSIRRELSATSSPAYYIDHIGTIYAGKKDVEKEIYNQLDIYRRAKKYLERRPVRNAVVTLEARANIYNLLQLRRQLINYYAKKKANRAVRTDKRRMAPQMGYYASHLANDMAAHHHAALPTFPNQEAPADLQ